VIHARSWTSLTSFDRCHVGSRTLVEYRSPCIFANIPLDYISSKCWSLWNWTCPICSYPTAYPSLVFLDSYHPTSVLVRASLASRAPLSAIWLCSRMSCDGSRLELLNSAEQRGEDVGSSQSELPSRARANCISLSWTSMALAPVYYSQSPLIQLRLCNIRNHYKTAMRPTYGSLFIL
jgi:hypothetical protein